MNITSVIVAAAVMLASSPAVRTAHAQERVKPAEAIRFGEREADVATIDSIVAALYASVSGPVGKPRQWDRLKSLFHPQGRLIPTACDVDSRCVAHPSTPEEYRRTADVFMVYEGLREREVARRTSRFGNVAQLWSTYESYRRSALLPFTRGIYAIELTWDGRRWWVMSVTWDEERPGLTLPAEYQPSTRKP